ncbi:MAG: hypothetical protein ACK52I_17250 [Pseudomonadota bacterium]
MTPRRFLVLLTGALAMIGLALWLSSQRHLPRDADFGAAALPGLAGQLDAVTGVRLVGPGNATLVSLAKTGDGWRVEEAGYAADAGRVRGLLVALGELEVVEPKTAIAANYPVLGVEDVAAVSAGGVRIELQGLREPLALVVGRSPGPRSTFVRRAHAAQALEVRPALEVPREPRAWLDRRVVDVAAERIASIEIDGERHAPDAVPGQSGTLGNLEFDAVERASDFAATGAPRVATWRTREGLVLRFEGYDVGSDRWLALTASAEAPAGNERPSGTPAGTSGEAPDAAAEAERLAARARDWRYRVPQFRWEAIFRRPDAAEAP